jgi:hypothetical protein
MKPYEHVLTHPLVTSILDHWPGAIITMREPNAVEIQGIMEGAAKGGEYMDGIGKTDLATMTENEYLCLVETIIRAYEEKCIYIRTDGDPMDNVPF